MELLIYWNDEDLPDPYLRRIGELVRIDNLLKPGACSLRDERKGVSLLNCVGAALLGPGCNLWRRSLGVMGR